MLPQYQSEKIEISQRRELRIHGKEWYRILVNNGIKKIPHLKRPLPLLNENIIVLATHESFDI